MGEIIILKLGFFCCEVLFGIDGPYPQSKLQMKSIGCGCYKAFSKMGIIFYKNLDFSLQ